MNKLSLILIFLLSTPLFARPDWYNQLGNLNGVNLPRPTPERDLVSFFNHPDFISNLSQNKWTTVRLPLEWEQFSDEYGHLETNSLKELEKQLQSLKKSLYQIHLATNQRILLIMDFHQFKFGKQCGGTGVPSKAIISENISHDDPNCIFKAFRLFWDNHQKVQDKWFEFAKHSLTLIAKDYERDQTWLTVGIEPLNEPYYGSNQEILPNNSKNPLQLLRLLKIVSNKLMQKTIEEDLYPFYQNFIKAIEEILPAQFLRNSLFILDPILFDHLGTFLGPIPMFVSGDYQIFKRLKSSPLRQTKLTWMAAPHHYTGSYDPAFFDLFPQLLVPMLKTYPNQAFNRRGILYRMQLQHETFKKIGMEMLLGEWGTYFALKSPSGEMNGAHTYTKDVTDGVKKYYRGHLWWIYDYTNEHEDHSYYLLQGHEDNQRSQRLKEHITRYLK